MKTSRDPRSTELAGRLVELLLEALRGLALAGEPRRAGLLAGRAWAATRHEHPALADRINRAMHHLARLEARAQPREQERR